jgi:hypothetical protein
LADECQVCDEKFWTAKTHDHNLAKWWSIDC